MFSDKLWRLAPFSDCLTLQQFCLRTDASDAGIWGVLMQDHDGTIFPVCYISKKLNDHEWKYSTMKECFTIVEAVRMLRHHLRGVVLCSQTDHQPLTNLDEAKFHDSMKWALFLQSFNLIIESIKGVDSVGADFMSHGELFRV